MFEISWSEIFIVIIVAIIFVGPKELPGMLRTVGRMLGQLRRTAGEFQRTFNEALKEAERQANVEKMRKDLDEVRNVDPTRDLRKSFDELKGTFSGKPTDPVPPRAPAAPEGAPAAVVPLSSAPQAQMAAAAASVAPVPVMATASVAPVPVAPAAPAPAAEGSAPALERVAGERR